MDTTIMKGKPYTQQGFDDLLRRFVAESPKDVAGVSNASVWYWSRKLLRWCMKIMYIENVPDEWDMNYFWEHLFIDGAITITDTQLGVLPLKCAWTGVNVFNHPTDVIISVPVLGDLERQIDIDCALVHLQYDYMGITEFIERYAYFFASIDSSLSVNLINTKTAWLGEAATKAQADTIKKIMDDISGGKPGVVVRAKQGDAPLNITSFNITNTFISDKLLSLQRSFMNAFLTDLGIPNYNEDKKARLNTEEVHGNDIEVMFSIQDWVDNIQSGLDTANKLYDLDLKLVVRSQEEIKKKIEEASANIDSDSMGDKGGDESES